MLPLLTPAEMYDTERRFLAAVGMPSIDLMERAALGFTGALEARAGGFAGKRIAVACGAGSNGGDGYAVGRMIRARGGAVTVIPLCDEGALRGDALVNYGRARESGVEIADPWDIGAVAEPPDIWVDAVFGIGLSRPAGGEYGPVFARMAAGRAQGAFIASIDLPSGLDGKTGLAQGLSVRADMTVTFQCIKTGHLLNDGPDICGELIVCDIGIGLDFLPDGCARLAERSDLKPVFPPRKKNTHKGHYGHLLVIAGSAGMAGAAILTARAAMRAGAGLVTVACPESVAPVIQAAEPCAMCLPLPDKGGALSKEAAPVLEAAFNGKSALAVGPGLSRKAHPKTLRAALSADLPAVFDADALNIIAERLELKALLNERHVITPHPGEAARLIGNYAGDPLEGADKLRELGPVALLKGAASVIRGERAYISASGSPGMAAGGSGDALTGIIGALLAAGHPPETAAWAGSELHGLAGERAARAMTETAMSAQDIIDFMPDALKRVAQE